MIHSGDRTKDLEDVSVLFDALIRYTRANEDRLDRSVEEIGYANLLKLADSAAGQVALQCDDGDWDGVVWFGRLQDIGDQSLAQALSEPGVDVAVAVEKWLLSISEIGPFEVQAINTAFEVLATFLGIADDNDQERSQIEVHGKQDGICKFKHNGELYSVARMQLLTGVKTAFEFNSNWYAIQRLESDHS